MSRNTYILPITLHDSRGGIWECDVARCWHLELIVILHTGQGCQGDVITCRLFSILPRAVRAMLLHVGAAWRYALDHCDDQMLSVHHIEKCKKHYFVPKFKSQ
jgi:hypothetical protein